MPQWRKFWTKTTESLDLADMPDDFTRLAWVMLPLVLDSKGRGIDNAAWLRSKLFPMRMDIDNEKMQAAMDWWVARGMLAPYSVDGRRYFNIPTWPTYQGNTDKEAASTIPAPPWEAVEEKVTDPPATAAEPNPPKVQTSSGPTPDLLTTNSALDADADADSEEIQKRRDSDAKRECQQADTAGNNGLNPGQSQFLTLFGAKRFKNTVQRETVGTLVETYGAEALLGAGRWAALKGMSLGDGIAAVQKALPKWGNTPAPPGGNGHVNPEAVVKGL